MGLENPPEQREALTRKGHFQAQAYFVLHHFKG